MPLSVVVVDDDGPFRELAARLMAAEGFLVLGEAADGLSAVSEVRRLRPDVVLLDVQLSDLDAFEVARRLATDTASLARNRA